MCETKGCQVNPTSKFPKYISFIAFIKLWVSITYLGFNHVSRIKEKFRNEIRFQIYVC